VAGTLAATGSMDVHGLFALLALASFLGDNTNYWTGRFVGPRIFTREQSRLLNPAHLERTRQFYDKFGPQMIIFARFLPIIRTFAPFVAGIARMLYSKFLFYSFAGCIFWIGFFVYCGYYFGNIPFVKKNLTLFILAIIFISILPGVIGFVRQRLRRT
jgi:membrane-associated protein